MQQIGVKNTSSIFDTLKTYIRYIILLYHITVVYLMVTSTHSKVLVVNIMTKQYTSKLTQHAMHFMKIILTTFSLFLAPVRVLTSSNCHRQAVTTISVTVHYLMYHAMK